MRRVSARDSNWLATTLESVRDLGYIIVEDALTPAEIEAGRKALYHAAERNIAEIGVDRLRRAGENGTIRVMMKYDPFFVGLLQNNVLLSVVDATVSNTAILHTQNGLVLAPAREGAAPIYQNTLHMDFPRTLNGYMASINVMFAIDEYTAQNGGTMVVPGTHQRSIPPDKEYLQKYAVPVECQAGSALIFDSTLYHAAGRNNSGKDRLAINHIFTRSFFKQQIDYVRALGEEFILKQPPRTQQLLGYYTRVPASSDEYYKPEEERVYRKHQG